MVKDFHMDDGINASFYAGILISAFSLAEALTGMFWGGLSDRLGRKPILLSGCIGTMVSLILVGIAPNFWIALAARALGGALNGNIGVIQTMVGELVKRPEHERESMILALYVSMRMANYVSSSGICDHAFCLVNWNHYRARYINSSHVVNNTADLTIDSYWRFACKARRRVSLHISSRWSLWEISLPFAEPRLFRLTSP